MSGGPTPHPLVMRWVPRIVPAVTVTTGGVILALACAFNEWIPLVVVFTVVAACGMTVAILATVMTVIGVITGHRNEHDLKEEP